MRGKFLGKLSNHTSSIRLPSGLIYICDKQIQLYNCDDLRYICDQVSITDDQKYFILAKSDNEIMLTAVCYPSEAEQITTFVANEKLVENNINSFTYEDREYIKLIKDFILASKNNINLDDADITKLNGLWNSDVKMTNLLNALLCIPEISTIWFRAKTVDKESLKLGIHSDGLHIYKDDDQNAIHVFRWCHTLDVAHRGMKVFIRVLLGDKHFQKFRTALHTEPIKQLYVWKMRDKAKLLQLRSSSSSTEQLATVFIQMANQIAAQQLVHFIKSAQSVYLPADLVKLHDHVLEKMSKFRGLFCAKSPKNDDTSSSYTKKPSTPPPDIQVAPVSQSLEIDRVAEEFEDKVDETTQLDCNRPTKPSARTIYDSDCDEPVETAAGEAPVELNESEKQLLESLANMSHVSPINSSANESSMFSTIPVKSRMCNTTVHVANNGEGDVDPNWQLEMQYKTMYKTINKTTQCSTSMVTSYVSVTRKQPEGLDSHRSLATQPHTSLSMVNGGSGSGSMLDQSSADEMRQNSLKVSPKTTSFVASQPKSSGFVPPSPNSAGFVPPPSNSVGFVPPSPNLAGFVSSSPKSSGIVPPSPRSSGIVPPSSISRQSLDPFVINPQVYGPKPYCRGSTPDRSSSKSRIKPLSTDNQNSKSRSIGYTEPSPTLNRQSSNIPTPTIERNKYKSSSSYNYSYDPVSTPKDSSHNDANRISRSTSGLQQPRIMPLAQANTRSMDGQTAQFGPKQSTSSHLPTPKASFIPLSTKRM